LLKTDVDGFDYDVIDSAELLLTSQHPMIFFECFYNAEYQMLGYKKTIDWLKAIGYVNYTVFDNFGQVIVRTYDIEQVFQLMNYVWQQNTNSATRTIAYYDILAITENDIDLVNKVLCDY
jgi:hypothetical protein